MSVSVSFLFSVSVAVIHFENANSDLTFSSRYIFIIIIFKLKHFKKNQTYRLKQFFSFLLRINFSILISYQDLLNLRIPLLNVRRRFPLVCARNDQLRRFPLVCARNDQLRRFPLVCAQTDKQLPDQLRRFPQVCSQNEQQLPDPLRRFPLVCALKDQLGRFPLVCARSDQQLPVQLNPWKLKERSSGLLLWQPKIYFGIIGW